MYGIIKDDEEKPADALERIAIALEKIAVALDRRPVVLGNFSTGRIGGNTCQNP